MVINKKMVVNKKMVINKKIESFLLVGHEGSHNKGCEALVRTAIDIIKSEFPNSLITVASMYPEHDVVLNDIKNIKVIHGISKIRNFNYSTKTLNARISLLDQFRQVIIGLAKFILPLGIVPIIKKQIKQSRPNKEEAFKQVEHLKQKMISSTAVISIGGDLFIDNWSEPPIYALESIEFAQFLGCKTIVLGASIWPFKTHWLQKRVKIMLEQCNGNCSR